MTGKWDKLFSPKLVFGGTSLQHFLGSSLSPRLLLLCYMTLPAHSTALFLLLILYPLYSFTDCETMSPSFQYKVRILAHVNVTENILILKQSTPLSLVDLLKCSECLGEQTTRALNRWKDKNAHEMEVNCILQGKGSSAGRPKTALNWGICSHCQAISRPCCQLIYCTNSASEVSKVQCTVEAQKIEQSTVGNPIRQTHVIIAFSCLRKNGDTI